MNLSSPSTTSTTTSANMTNTDFELGAMEILRESKAGPKRSPRKALLFGTALLGLICLTVLLVTFVKTESSQEEMMLPEPIQTSFPVETSSSEMILQTSAPVITPVVRTASPTGAPTLKDSPQPTRIAFDPGNLIEDPHGLLLSVGLEARILAQSGSHVRYEAGNESDIPFHELPDFGGTFVDPRLENPGGWIYVSNSEIRRPWNNGGVGALTFNADGQIIDYRMLLEGTTSNCGGGVTPWGSWVSGEEYREGLFWQVDPTGQRPAEILTVGNEGGMYESFAADPRRNQYFVTEDFVTGPVRRFVPFNMNPTDPWEDLHGDGDTTYLRLLPTSEQEGTFEWTSDKSSAQSNAQALYPNSEGIDVHGDTLYFVSKRIHTVFVLDLEGNTYTSYSTRQGLFQGQPDQIIQFKDRKDGDDTMFFFTEDGSASAGIHARNTNGDILTILEGPTFSNEATGLAFSPDYMHMYVAFQDDGVLFEVVREDGLPFTARSLNLRYHSSDFDAVQ